MSSGSLYSNLSSAQTMIFPKWFTIFGREMSVRPDASRFATTVTQECAATETQSRQNGDHTRGGPLAPLFELDDDLLYARRLQSEIDSEDCALRLQNAFDIEDRALFAERTMLSQVIQRVFVCGVCMEEMPEDSVARLDPCGHSFCRECIRAYVSTRLEEHRFPVLCPTCTAGKGKGTGATGE
ncbi:hypothetical protein EDB83DRAFT_232435 [Lactarius deliciosus]|nr:hypothetical protein EDB83DRAFT_232435 [Lactarius deliciosus]